MTSASFQVFQFGQVALLIGFVLLMWPWRRVSRFVVTRTLRASRPEVWDALVGTGEIKDDKSPRHPILPSHLVSRTRIAESPEIWENVFDKSGGKRAVLSVEHKTVLLSEEPRHYVSRFERLNNQLLPLGPDAISDYLFDETPEGTRVTYTRELTTKCLWHYLHVRRLHAKALDNAASFFDSGNIAAASGARRKLLISGSVSVLAVASFVMWLGWIAGALLTAILLMHEFGHWAAMRLTGQPSSRMMLIPFFGGLAIPEHEHKSLFDEAFCALMGAGLSAIVCGALVAVYYVLGAPHPEHGTSSFVLETRASVWAVCALLIAAAIGLINIIQLLPIPPLDGGLLLGAILQSTKRSAARPALLLATSGIFALAVWQGAILLALVAAIGALQVYATGQGEPVRRPMSGAELAGIAFGIVLTAGIHLTPIMLIWSSLEFDLAMPWNESALSTESSRDWQRCAGEDTSSPDQQIAGCSAVIDPGREPRETLAIAFYNRAYIYREKGEHAHALADYHRALALGPDPETRGEIDAALKELDVRP